MTLTLRKTICFVRLDRALREPQWRAVALHAGNDGAASFLCLARQLLQQKQHYHTENVKSLLVFRFSYRHGALGHW